MTRTRMVLWTLAPALVGFMVVTAADAANVTSGSGNAVRYGTHEITLAGSGSVVNPFDTVARVTFTPASDPAKAVTVDAFYDGGNSWRARVYVTETGEWKWTSACESDAKLNGRVGSFIADSSALPGTLRRHANNPRAWMTDDGRTFLNLSDTAYRLFHGRDAPLWREFVNDSAAKGINCLRVAALGGWGGTPGAKVDDNDTWVWNDPWPGGIQPDLMRFDVVKFQNSDERIIWLLNQHPEMKVQLILFSFKGYGSERTGKHWAALPQDVRQRTMRYMLARWSAFPNLFWLIVNDMHCDAQYPQNQAFVREVGRYFAAHDPWHHLISTGPNRGAGFPFTTADDLEWCSYIHIEHANSVGADAITEFGFDKLPLHVWMAEDYYEQDHGHYQDPRFFFRWLFWSWALSGGSGNYCGRWGPIHPYSQTSRRDFVWVGIDKQTTYTGEQLVGLDSVPHIAAYFRDRKIDLAGFQPNDRRVTDLDGRVGRLRPKLMENGTSEFLIYHPNAAADGHAAVVDGSKTARLRIDLVDAKGEYQVEWYQAIDGVAQRAANIKGGETRELTAPWAGQDVVLRLVKLTSDVGNLGDRTKSNSEYSAAQLQEMATNQLKRVTMEMSARCLEDVRTLEDWQRQRDQRRRELLDMLGLDPLPERTPLQARITGTLDRPAYRIEKVVFQSSPGLYVTGHFYIPKDGQHPLPTILYLCGHSPHPQGAKTQYQDRTQWFASHGYAVLVLDTLEFAEVEGPHHGTHNLRLWHWLSLGYTPAGVEVWNAMRALDYLETRREVDMKRIGLTGISGGGAMTWYTAAVDERIAVAAPSCSTFTYGSQAEHWLASGQCDCIYYINTYGWDFPMVGALIAPRPLIILSGQQDTIFPPDGYHAAFQRAKRVYDLYGSSDRIQEFDDNVPHSDSPRMLVEARQWMQRWLKSDSSPVPLEEKPALQPETPEDLACLTAPPNDAINDRIHDQFIPLPQSALPQSRVAWEKRRVELLAELRAKVFGRFPRETVPFDTQTSRNTGGWSAKYAEFKEVTFATEEGVRIRAQLYQPKNSHGETPLLVHVKRPGDSFYSSDFDERLPVLDRAFVLVVEPRFTEQLMSTAEYTDIERTAAWTGRTMASMQVWDTLRAIAWAVEEAKIPATKIAMYGRDDAGVVALYAALFDERVNALILADPPASHWQRPALPNVLRVTDLPEAAAALAPRELIFLRAMPPGFETTDALLKRTGNASSVRVAGSLAAGLGLAK